MHPAERAQSASAARVMLQSGPFSPVFARENEQLPRAGGFRASSRLRVQQLATRQPQIGQRKQRVQLFGVLGQTAITNIHMPELALDHAKWVLHLGSDQ